MICSLNMSAQECEFPLAVLLDVSNIEMSDQSANALLNRINSLASSEGMTASGQYTPFTLIVKVDQTDINVLPGPPKQYVSNLGLTFFITESNTNKRFASEYMELTGIGNNADKSLMNAFSYLKTGNGRIASLLRNGRQRIISYYDSQADNIMKEAGKLSAMHKDDQAIALLASTPSCAQCYDRMMDYCIELYKKNMNRLNEKLFNAANAIWLSSQTEEAALEAAYLLSNVDPESQAHPKAVKLLNEIGENVASDKLFEQREKYKDSVAMKGKLLETLKAIGVAYGNGQKESTTNLIVK